MGQRRPGDETDHGLGVAGEPGGPRLAGKQEARNDDERDS